MIDQNHNEKKSLFRDILSTSLGWELAVPIFLGLLVGYALDKHFGTGYSLTLILLISGIVIGYYSLYKYIEMEVLRQKAKNKHQGEDEQLS